MEWFESWFDSPYYHLLYQHRDEEEAALFLSRLSAFLSIPKTGHLLDLACGKGRHARYLNGLGYEVTGLDLSGNSIEEASKSANDRLHFAQQDMRDPLSPGKYDAVLNLFTSFGYFSDLGDNRRVLRNVYESLKPDGLLVIDFMNAEKVVANLVKQERKELGGVIFHISRRVEDGLIVKTIDFEDGGQSYHFEERVQAIYLKDFEEMLLDAGFELKQSFGNYHLEPFVAAEADRLILLCSKP